MMLAATGSGNWKKHKDSRSRKHVAFTAAAMRQTIVNKQRRRRMRRNTGEMTSLGLRRWVAHPSCPISGTNRTPSHRESLLSSVSQSVIRLFCLAIVDKQVELSV